MDKQQIIFLKKQFDFIQSQNSNTFKVSPIVTNRNGTTFSIFNVSEDAIAKLRLLTPNISYGSFIVIDRIWVSSNNHSYISNDSLKILLNETLTNNLGNKSTFKPFTTSFGNNNLNINQLTDKIYGIHNNNTLNTIKKYKIRFRCYSIKVLSAFLKHINYAKSPNFFNLDKPKVLGDPNCNLTHYISYNSQCLPITASFSIYNSPIAGVQTNTHYIWHTKNKYVWEQCNNSWNSGQNGPPQVDVLCAYRCRSPIPQDPN